MSLSQENDMRSAVEEANKHMMVFLFCSSFSKNSLIR